MHIGVVSWSHQRFEIWLSSIKPNLENELLFVCCKEEELELYSKSAAESNAIVFSPEKCGDVFRLEKSAAMHTIGHCRNLILLASHIFDRKENLVFFDDDVFPTKQSIRSFDVSFEKYDLVQGNYFGDDANGIRQAVMFFGMLEKIYAQDSQQTGDFNDCLNCLRGKCGTIQDGQIEGLKGSAGGVLGISSNLKTRMHFAPTIYRCEDHFFEFSSRFKLKDMRFMSPSIPVNDIPIARHSHQLGDLNSLVSNYLLELRSQVAEKYLYFKLVGALPAIVNGRHVLVRSASFEPITVAQQCAQESALPKIQAAAMHYLSKNPPDEITTQLQRFTNITSQDFTLSLAELEKILSDFKEEGEMFEKTIYSWNKEKMKEELLKLIVQTI